MYARFREALSFERLRQDYIRRLHIEYEYRCATFSSNESSVTKAVRLLHDSLEYEGVDFRNL